jgi:ABC-type dipeptide/oligopeptide/nickel transport system permease component
LSYLLRRCVIALITLFFVSILCFGAFSVIHGDPASLAAGTEATGEQLETIRENMGLNRPLIIRYFDWLLNLLCGNLGNSLRFQRESISSLIAQRLPVSLSLALLSLFFIFIISLTVSLLTVKKEGDFFDRIVNFLTAAGISVPGFYLGLLFIFIFGYFLRIFTPGEYIDFKEDITGFFLCLVFPSFAIAIPNSAVLIKFLRSSLFQELQKDYVRTAKSKGLKSFYILRRHVLKNALIPAVTVFGMIIAEVFSGSIIIEQVFSVPGIGRLLITSINSRDYPLIQSLMIYIAFIVVIANTISDIIIMMIDPRIRISSAEIK